MPWKGPVPKILCPECGEHMMYRRALKCRDCYRKAVAKALCPKCGGPMPNPNAERCWACFQAERTANRSQPACIDCGKLISWQVGTGKDKKRPSRCWDCEIKRRRTLATGGKQARYKGSPKAKSLLRKLPCAVCGYDRLNSHVHRLVPALGYQVGNMVQLCSRCHDEIHRGITAAPPATVLTQ